MPAKVALLITLSLSVPALCQPRPPARPTAQQSPVKTIANFDVLGGEALPTDLILGTDNKIYGALSIGNGCSDHRVPDELFTVDTSGPANLTTIFQFNSTFYYHPNAILQGSDGSLYITTQCGGYGSGALINVTTQGIPAITAPGAYDPAIIHMFNGTDGSGETGDGFNPGPLVQASNGEIYGVTCGDYLNSFGTIFKFNPTAAFYPNPAADTFPNSAALTTVYRFIPIHEFDPGQCPNSLIQATDGNLYGTTFGDGISEPGTIFRLSVDGTFTPLFAFEMAPGVGLAVSGIIQASNGNIYGTVWGNQSNCLEGASPYAPSVISGWSNPNGGCGEVFEMSLQGQVSILHVFDTIDGAWPGSGVVEGADGNLYGAATTGGIAAQLVESSPNVYQRTGFDGTLFKVTRSGEFSVIHNFENLTDGSFPTVVISGPPGRNLYGATRLGGPNNSGVVFNVSDMDTKNVEF